MTLRWCGIFLCSWCYHRVLCPDATDRGYEVQTLYTLRCSPSRYPYHTPVHSWGDIRRVVFSFGHYWLNSLVLCPFDWIVFLLLIHRLPHDSGCDGGSVYCLGGRDEAVGNMEY